MKYLFLTIIFTCVLIHLQAQTDSIQVKELLVDETDEDIQEYDYVKNSLKDEKTLIKFSPFNIGDNHSAYSFINYGLKIGIERKFKTNFSLSGEVGYNHSDYGNTYYNNKSIVSRAELRYYYNLLKRMKQGKTGNNFSSNYLFINFSNYTAVTPIKPQIFYSSLVDPLKPYMVYYPYYITYDHDPPSWDFTKGQWKIIKQKEYVEPMFTIQFGYGIQRKFAKIFYYDIKFTAIYEFNRPTYGSKISVWPQFTIGLGL